MTRPRFASWTAVSSQPQAEKISLEDQRDKNHDYISHHNGILIAELQVKESRDIAEFSEAAERIEAYAELRHLLRTRAIDVLVCYTRSRLGRTLALVETIAELCRRANIIIVETDSPPPNLDAPQNSDADLLTGAVRSWSAQREIAELRRRHAMGMMGRLKRGEFVASVPWGWRVKHDPDSGIRTIEIDPVAAETIRYALIELYLNQGLGAVVIARRLNEAGRLGPTGKTWLRSGIGDMFRLIHRYAGYGELNARSKERPYARAEGQWPKIISDEELKTLIHERSTRRGKRGDTDHTYRFSQMIWCASCKKIMWFSYTRYSHTLMDGTETEYKSAYATCFALPRHPKATMGMKRAMKKVRDFFIFLQDNHNWGPYMVSPGPDPAEIDAKISALEEDCQKVEGRIYDADDKLIDGTLTIDRHAHQIKRLKDQLLRLQSEITTLHESKAQVIHLHDRRQRLEEIARHGLSYLDMADERAANARLRRLIRIWAQGGHVVEIEVL